LSQGRLFELVQAKPVADIPRSFADYEITVNEADLPTGVSLIRRVG